MKTQPPPMSPMGQPKRALQAAGVSPQQLDVIIVGNHNPRISFFLQQAACYRALLGAKNAYAFDLMAGCSGFLYTLHVAEGNNKNRVARRKILVIGVDTLVEGHRLRGSFNVTCILFGDGAGAAVLTASDEPGNSLIHSQFGWKRLGPSLCSGGRIENAD